jgi:hypothetical protein
MEKMFYVVLAVTIVVAALVLGVFVGDLIEATASGVEAVVEFFWGR